VFLSLRSKPLKSVERGSIAEAPVAAERGAWTAAFLSFVGRCATKPLDGLYRLEKF